MMESTTIITMMTIILLRSELVAIAAASHQTTLASQETVTKVETFLKDNAAAIVSARGAVVEAEKELEALVQRAEARKTVPKGVIQEGLEATDINALILKQRKLDVAATAADREAGVAERERVREVERLARQRTVEKERGSREEAKQAMQLAQVIIQIHYVFELIIVNDTTILVHGSIININTGAGEAAGPAGERGVAA
jgi:hypothetical protein